MTVAAERLLATGAVRASAGALWADGRAALLAAGIVVPVGAASGGYYPPAWGWAALALAWSAALALAVRPQVRLGRLELAALAAIGGLALWTAASLAWSPAAGPAVLELERTLVYAAALLAALTVVRSSSYRSLAAGVWAGAALLAAYAVVTRLFPDRFPVEHLVANNRLSTPLGYWNALGALAAVGAVLASGLVAHARALGIRMVAAASLVPLALALYFTFSRGAWVALAAGLVAALALESRRLALAGTLAVTLPFAAAAVLVASGSEALTSVAADPAAAADGRRVFGIATVLACGAAVAAAAAALAAQRVRLGERARRAIGAALLAAVVVAAAGALAGLGGPAAAARDAWAAFQAPPVALGPAGNLNERLFSLSGSWRVDLWRVALDGYGAHPWTGAGAGTYERTWLEQRPSAVKVRDAHSVYLETLAELGPVGLGLLAVALGAPLAAAVRARRRALVPAAAGAYAAYLLHAGVDWDWEIPALTLAALCTGAACLAAARGRAAPRPLGPRRRYALLGAAALIAAASAVGLASSRPAAEAQAYGDVEAAAAAARWAPWAAEPRRLLGEAHLHDGDLAAARASFRAGLARDPGDWQLWLGLALATESPELRARAAERALALNPLSPELHAIAPALGLEAG